ncbi:oxygenase MpaB family protein [Mycolicibacterium sp. 120270]|uniref:oxygenase MpaB family protein n=1 Tax=Mycolicibacterium sp. 120270 TaxID=3090600 RepID=UPI00299D4CC8|nr:oxygenase MpaB family protein [Mycolicibacterium sp. 120270]MDX1883370.1 oxygenase MpaB family protein [Mycolicibacterium sp. 120270]
MSEGTRISVKRQTARWDPDAEVSVKDAMDFWSFAAAAANVVMQLSLPGVGYGVVESKVDSGSILKHPWKRLRTTSQYLAVAVFGSEQDRAAFRAAVDGAHRQVISTDESPVKYNAFDRDLQMWVAACLFVGLEDTYKLLRGEMTAEQAEQFYRSAWTLGTTLQVTEDQWPPTRADFDQYWDTACKQVAIDPPVRDYLMELINLRMINPLLGLPFRPLLKFLTIGFLAPVFRDALGVKWSRGKQRRFEWLFLLVAFVNRFMPVFLRQGGSFIVLADVRRRVRANNALV